MSLNTNILAFVPALLMVVNCGGEQLSPSAPARASAAPDIACEVTRPNGETPPGEAASPDVHGNGALWTWLWPEGTVVFEPGGPGFVEPDGSLSMKFGWWRGIRGRLRIEGRRLDTPARPLRAHIPSGYGDVGFQPTSLIFSTAGCWEVTGRVGDASLTFVTRVINRWPSGSFQ
jgi:hypothetical protein